MELVNKCSIIDMDLHIPGINIDVFMQLSSFPNLNYMKLILLGCFYQNFNGL
jgi:hypothetical protein